MQLKIPNRDQEGNRYPVNEETKQLAERFFLGSYVSSYTLEIFSNIPDNLMQSIRDHSNSAGNDYDEESCSDTDS
jgi:hypothetical protein